MITRGKQLPLFILTAVLSITAATSLVSCGWHKDTTAEVKDGKVTIVMSEYRLRPNKITTRPGTIEIKAVNSGRLAHNLIIMDGKRLVARTPTFQSGSRTIKTELRAGTYKMMSNIGKDEDLGVRGTITVK